MAMNSILCVGRIAPDLHDWLHNLLPILPHNLLHNLMQRNLLQGSLQI